MANGKRLIASTPQGELRLLGTGGTYALRSHTQIRQYLRASLGEDYASLLAEPSFDNANNRIDWLADLGEDAAPLSTLPPEQAQPLRAELAEKRQRITELAETLARREQQSAILLGELLRQALSVPNESSVLVSDGKLVLINWGAAADRSESDLPTTRLTAPGRAAPVQRTVAQPVPVAVAAPQRTRSYWLWALPLWLVFAALMAGIYYLLLEACAVSGPGPEDDGNPFISFCPGEPVAAAEPPPELAAEEARARVLREQLNQLEIAIAEARRACSRQQTLNLTPTPFTPGSFTPIPLGTNSALALGPEPPR